MNSSLVPLTQAVIEAFLFLETSGNDEVNPDSAVRCMENMSSNLLSLSQSGQIDLREMMRELAANSQDPSYSKFVAELPDMIGLANS